MPMDKNPHHIFLDVTNMEANVDSRHRDDFITIEFAGTVTPTLKERITKAFKDGRFEIIPKKFG